MICLWESIQRSGKEPLKRKIGDLEIYGEDERLLYIQGDFRDFLRKVIKDKEFIKKDYGIDVVEYGDVFHFAAIVGGRAKIDGDPMMVALDLSIDAEFFTGFAEKNRKEYCTRAQALPIL